MRLLDLVRGRLADIAYADDLDEAGRRLKAAATYLEIVEQIDCSVTVEEVKAANERLSKRLRGDKP